MAWQRLARLARASVSAGLLAVHTGCADPAVFACVSDEQCGAVGRCEASGYCSFPDAACESGRRYAPLSREDLAGTCVPLSVADDSTSASSEEITGSTGGPTNATSTGPLTSTETTPTTAADTTDPSTASHGDTEVGDTEEVDPRVHDGLIAYYTFQEGTGTTVHDLSDVLPPLDLTLVGSGFTWTGTGLHSAGQGIILGESSASKIRVACQATDELTLEAWITPQHSVQPLGSQPARVVTYSFDASQRNFTLGQGTEDWFGMQTSQGFAGRVRTTDAGTENGTNPSLYVEVDVPTTAQHVVYTRRKDGVETLLRDAVVIGTQADKTGDFSTWNGSTDFKLALGNEVGLGRAFVGEFHLVAIYDRALTQTEVEQNFDAGYDAPRAPLHFVEQLDGPW